MQAKLRVTGGKANKREVLLNIPIIVGRSRGAGLTIAHPMVSREHCEIFESDGLLRIRDLNSTNGTYVSGQKVEEAALRPHEQFSIGPLTFEVEYESNVDATVAQDKPEQQFAAAVGPEADSAISEPTPVEAVFAPLPPLPAEDGAFDFLADLPAVPEAVPVLPTPPPQEEGIVAPPEGFPEVFAEPNDPAVRAASSAPFASAVDLPPADAEGALAPSTDEASWDVPGDVVGTETSEPQQEAGLRADSLDLGPPQSDESDSESSSWDDPSGDTPTTTSWNHVHGDTPTTTLTPATPLAQTKPRRGWWPFKRDKAAAEPSRAVVQESTAPDFEALGDDASSEPPPLGAQTEAPELPKAPSPAGTPAAPRGGSSSDLDDFLNGLQ